MRKEIDKLNDRLMIDQGEYLGKIDDVRLDYEKLVDRHKKLVEFFRQGPTKQERASTRPEDFDEPLPAGASDEVTGRCERQPRLTTPRPTRTTSTRRDLPSGTAPSSARQADGEKPSEGY